jgi:hypothetical protein
MWSDRAAGQAVADLDRFKEFIEGQGSAAAGDTSKDGGVMSQEARTGHSEDGGRRAGRHRGRRPDG